MPLSKEKEEMKKILIKQSDNAKKLKKVYKQLKFLNNIQDKKAGIIINFLSRVFEDEETIEAFYDVITESEKSKTEYIEMREVLSMESALAGRKYIEKKTNETVELITIAVPVKNLIYDIYFQAKHTQLNEEIKIYYHNNYFYQNEIEQVLIVFKKNEIFYASPYEHFFSNNPKFYPLNKE